MQHPGKRQFLRTRMALPALAAGLLLLLACGGTPPHSTSPPAADKSGTAARSMKATADRPGDEASDVSIAILEPELQLPESIGDLDDVRKRRYIRALVSIDRTDFFMQGGRPGGLEYELLRDYQNYLNRDEAKTLRHIELMYLPLPFDQLLSALEQGRGDIVAAGMTVTADRRERVNFSTPYIPNVREIIVGHREAPPILKLDGLSGKQLHVISGSSYAEHLGRLNESLVDKGLKPVIITQAGSYLGVEDLLEMVDAGIIEYTVADEHLAKAWAEVLPDIVLFRKVPVYSGGKIAWAVRKNNPELLADINKFMRSYRKGTLLGNILYKRYFNNASRLSNPVSPGQQEKIRELSVLFKKYGEVYGFDWLSLAAQAYQESRLDNARVSPRGAVGIMQVQPSTASDQNVAIENVAELENNIHAGVKYLAFLRDRYFSDPEMDADVRLRFAQAAYNAGPARVASMRRKAVAMKLDPNLWFDNVELAALTMVGQETVRYVSNIEKYYVALTLYLDAQEKRAEMRGELEG